MFSRHKKEEPFKFQVDLTVKLITGLPAKYKHLRLMLTRGSKAAPTKELFAANQRCEPTAADGLMTCICTMYKQPNSNTFEEKMYKLSLYRINPKASMKKEKVIGATYIKLNNHVSIHGVQETLKLAMKADSGSVELTLDVKSHWQKHLKGSEADAMSDISAFASETASQATSNTSLNSIEEDDEEDLDPEPPQPPNPQETTPAKGQRESSAMLSPTANAAVDGNIQELKDALLKAQADLQWTNENLKDAEKQLTGKETELEEATKEVKRLEAELEGAVRVQEELMQENELAEKKYADLLAEVEGSAAKESGDSQQVSALKQEIASLKAEAASLKEDREKLRKELEEQRARKSKLEAELESAKKKSGPVGGSTDGQTIGELEASLEKEKAKASKFKGWLEKMTEAKGALESELAELRSKVGGADSTQKSEAENSAAKAEAGKESTTGEKVDKGELDKMAAEMERISMQLVTTSLAYAQAEQDRLEAKRQVYKLKDANRKLREKLTEMELSQAKAQQ